MRGVLIWVDIPAGVVHRTDPATGSDETIDVGSPGGERRADLRRPARASRPTTASVVSTPPRAISTRSGRIDVPPGVVMNDGKTDPAGRFWAGTKDAEGRRPLGSLYRLDPDRTVTEMVHGVTISNGLGWSPDGRTMYYIDSATYGIDAFDFDPESGAISERRRLVDLPGRGASRTG